MLILRIAIFSTLITIPVNGQTCSCGDTNPPPISSELRPALFQNPTSDGSTPCVSNCNYTVMLSEALAIRPDLGGLKAYVYSFSKGGSDDRLCFYDGMDSDVVVLCITENISGYDAIPVTVNPDARMVLVETSDTPAQFFVSYTPALKGAGPPTQAPTTLPTVLPTDPGLFDCNPFRVQFELSVIIDCSSHISTADFNEMRTFASVTLPRYLTIITQNDSKPYTRVMLTLAAPRNLTDPNSNYGTPFNPWDYTKEDFMTLVRVTAQPYSASSNNSAFAYAMSQTYSHGYNNSQHYPTRPNAARLMIILASADVDTDDAGFSNVSSPLKDMFTQLHQNNIPTLVLSFGRQSNIVNYGPWLYKTYVRSSDINTDDVFKNDIMNGLFCNGNNLCRQANCGNSHFPAIADQPILISTRNYMNENNTNDPNRYCNNMNCVTTITNIADPSNTCIQITVDSYEMETRNDYLSVVDENGEERAYFTGTGVSNSIVFVQSKATISFVSDYQQVYGGFNATISVVQSVANVTCLYPDNKKKHIEIDGVVF